MARLVSRVIGVPKAHFITSYFKLPTSYYICVTSVFKPKFGGTTATVRNSILLLCMFPLIILGMIFATIVIMDYFGALCPLMQGGCPADHTTHMKYGLMHWPEVWDAFWTALPYTLQIVGVWFIIAYCANTAIIRHTTHAKPLERKDNLKTSVLQAALKCRKSTLSKTMA